MVVPLTSRKGSRFRVDRDSKAQAEQIRSVAVERVGDRIGLVPHSLLERVDDAIRIHLDLDR